MELRGPRVTLRTPCLDDADRLFQWFADPEVTRFLPLAGQDHLPMEAIRSFLERVSVSDRPELAVSIDVDGQHVGCGGLRGIDVESAELSIVIGERRFRGCGIASEAMTLLLNHAFGVIGLKTVWLVVRADNARAVHLFEHFGFVRAEIRSAAVVVDGEPKDKWKMVLTASSWPCDCPTSGVPVESLNR
jgi:RimJ/RimL family protein N-acetyltransferase